MLAFVLLFGILFMALFAYLLSGRDVLDPWFISCALFALSLIVGMLNFNDWGISLSAKAVLIILCALMFFGMGKIVGTSIGSKTKPYELTQQSMIKINVSYRITIMVFIIDIIIAYLTYKKMLLLAVQAGYRGDNILWYVHYALNNLDLSWGIGMALLQHLVVGSCYVFTFIFINNYFSNRNKRTRLQYWYYLLPAIPHCTIQIMNAGRSGLIEYIVLVLFMTIIAWKLNHPTRHYPIGKFITIGLLAIGVFFVAFRLIGGLSGKSSVLNAWDNFSIYLGSPIAAFNQFLEGSAYNSSEFGLNSFKGIRSLISRLGFELKTVGTHDSFVYFANGLNTNIYTALKNYYVDFGFLGLMLIQITMGAFYSAFYKWLKVRKKFDFWVLIYAYFANNLVYQIFTSSFTTRLFSVAQILSIIFIVIWYYLLCKRSKKRVRLFLTPQRLNT